MKIIKNIKINVIIGLLFLVINGFGQYLPNNEPWGKLKRTEVKGDSLVALRIDSPQGIYFSEMFSTDTIKLRISADSLKNGNYYFRLEANYPIVLRGVEGQPALGCPVHERAVDGIRIVCWRNPVDEAWFSHGLIHR